MSRAPAGAGFLFVVAVALFVALSGPLLLFNPWFVSLEQQRSGVVPRLASNSAAVARVTDTILTDIFVSGDFVVSLDGRTQFLTAAERSHMRDVSGLVRTLVLIDAVALLLGIGVAWWMRREPWRIGRLLALGSLIVGAVAVALGALFALAFEPTFLFFHQIFFRPGTYLFPPNSNLIRLFPEQFWSEAAIVAGGAIVLSALIGALLGWRLASRDRRTLPRRNT